MLIMQRFDESQPDITNTKGGKDSRGGNDSRQRVGEIVFHRTKIIFFR